MDEEERKEVTSIISSILISTTKRMTIRQLDQDFTNTVGYKIPFKKFGCNNVEQFLRTLKDKVQVRGSGINAEVQVIVNNKTAHINELIAKQRPPKTSRSHHRPNRNFHYVPSRRNFSNFPNYVNNSIDIKPAEDITGSETSSNLDYMSVACSTPVPVEPNDICKGAVPKQRTNKMQNIEEIYFSDEENRKNTRVPLSVQDNLRRLIMKYSDGVMCSSLADIYKKQYRVGLNYNEYGYRSTAEMCADLKNIFNVVQLDKSDIKLFNKDAPIPEDTLNVVKKFQLLKIKASREAATDGNALPTDYVEDIMSQIYTENAPQDVFPLGAQLEKQWLDPGTGEQDYIDVNVAEVYDPSKFWINLKNYSCKLNGLMDELQIFYATHSRQLHVPCLALKKDMYVVCIFYGEYHRAKIVDASQRMENVVKVYFVDYGTVSVVSIENVCYLHNQFAELPEQAIRARLAGIYPPTVNEQWTRAAAARFLSFVMQKDLVAQIVKIDEERQTLDVVLADTSIEDEDFFINDALVSMGYALFTFQERKPPEPSKIVPIVHYIHLFPTHTELESGLVPSATQAVCMHQAGYAVEHMYPHYFKDAQTGLPISLVRAAADGAVTRNIDHSIDRNYYEEIEETQEEAPADDSFNDSRDISFHWEDVIEEVELRSPPGRSCSNNDDCLQDGEIVDMSDFQDEKATQTISSTATQTYIPATNNDPGESDIPINVTLKERLDTTNAVPASATKQPLRPPPGYNHIPPNRYNPQVQPNNYIHNQTYIGLPYCYQMPPYSTYNQYSDQYYSNAIQHLVQLGARLTLEQQNFLRSLGTQSGCSAPWEYSHHQSAAPPYGGTYSSYGHGQMYGQDFQQPGWGGQGTTKSATGLPQPETNHNFPTTITATYTKRPVNPIKIEAPIEVAQLLKPKPEAKSEIALPKTVSEEIIDSNKELPPTKDEKAALIDPSKEDQSSKTNQQEELPEIRKSCTEGAVEVEPSREELRNDIPSVETSDTREIKTSDSASVVDTSEVESVFEDCLSHHHGLPDLISSEEMCCKQKLITKIRIGEQNIHILNHKNEHYILLTELSKKVFGKTVTAIFVRKLVVGTPCIISVVDIRLKTYPKLKNELIMYDLITENDTTVNAVPIKYLKDLTKILSSTGDVGNFKDLFEGVDSFLSKLSLGSGAF